MALKNFYQMLSCIGFCNYAKVSCDTLQHLHGKVGSGRRCVDWCLFVDGNMVMFDGVYLLGKMAFSDDVTPWKINMDHNHGGLEDHFPF